MALQVQEERKAYFPPFMGPNPRMGRVWPQSEDEWLKRQWLYTTKSQTQIAEECGRGWTGIHERLIKHFGTDYEAMRGPKAEQTVHTTPPGQASQANLESQLICKNKQLTAMTSDNRRREGLLKQQIAELQQQLDEPMPLAFQGDPYDN